MQKQCKIEKFHGLSSTVLHYANQKFQENIFVVTLRMLIVRGRKIILKILSTNKSNNVVLIGISNLLNQLEILSVLF